MPRTQIFRIEGDLDRRQGESARNLSGIEGRLQETKGIFEDTMDNTVGSPDEALPILRVVAENLGRVADELEVVVQLVNVGEVEGGKVPRNSTDRYKRSQTLKAGRMRYMLSTKLTY